MDVLEIGLSLEGFLLGLESLDFLLLRGELDVGRFSSGLKDTTSVRRRGACCVGLGVFARNHVPMVRVVRRSAKLRGELIFHHPNSVVVHEGNPAGAVRVVAEVHRGVPQICSEHAFAVSYAGNVTV